MSTSIRKVRRLRNIEPAAIPFQELLDEQQPVILEQVASAWPLVEAGRRSRSQAAEYLAAFASNRPVTVFESPPEQRGRFHYKPDSLALNFSSIRADLRETLSRMIESGEQTDAPALYVGSTDLDMFLPGFREENDLSLIHPQFVDTNVLASIWIGNRTTVPAHFDMSNNLACSLVGKRRFTLFPPDQIESLYPGPLEPTPAGQVVSMVDFSAPDLQRYPRFPEALAAAQIAELEPGDVLFYPALWWHQVEALDGFNVMVNYWWNPVPDFLDTPQTTLLHALLSIRDRPESEKTAWKAFFDYYVFGKPDMAGAHLPTEMRGAIGPLNPTTARRFGDRCLNLLNR